MDCGAGTKEGTPPSRPPVICSRLSESKIRRRSVWWHVNALFAATEAEADNGKQ
jgi:hypothetical protein